jgi:hypothetical protein
MLLIDARRWVWADNSEDLTVRSGETIAAHQLDEPEAKTSASRSSGVVPKSSVLAYGMEDVVDA